MERLAAAFGACAWADPALSPGGGAAWPAYMVGPDAATTASNATKVNARPASGRNACRTTALSVRAVNM